MAAVVPQQVPPPTTSTTSSNATTSSSQSVITSSSSSSSSSSGAAASSTAGNSSSNNSQQQQQRSDYNTGSDNNKGAIGNGSAVRIIHFPSSSSSSSVTNSAATTSNAVGGGGWTTASSTAPASSAACSTSSSGWGSTTTTAASSSTGAASSSSGSQQPHLPWGSADNNESKRDSGGWPDHRFNFKNAPPPVVEMTDIRKAAILSGGWGQSQVNQESAWDAPASPPATKDPPAPPPMVPQAGPSNAPMPVAMPNINWLQQQGQRQTNKAGTEIWETTIRSRGSKAPGGVVMLPGFWNAANQQAPTPHTPTSNIGGTWGEDDAPVENPSSMWTGAPPPNAMNAPLSGPPPPTPGMQGPPPPTGLQGPPPPFDPTQAADLAAVAAAAAAGGVGSWPPVGPPPNMQQPPPNAGGPPPGAVNAGPGAGQPQWGDQGQHNEWAAATNVNQRIKAAGMNMMPQLQAAVAAMNLSGAAGAPGAQGWPRGPPPPIVKKDGWGAAGGPSELPQPQLDDGTAVWGNPRQQQQPQQQQQAQQQNTAGMIRLPQLNVQFNAVANAIMQQQQGAGGGPAGMKAWNGMDQNGARAPGGPPPPHQGGANNSWGEPDMWGKAGPSNMNKQPGNMMNDWSDGQIDTSSWGGPKQGGKPLSKDLIIASLQFRILTDMGYKKDDVENVLRACNMNLEEAIQELQDMARRGVLNGSDVAGGPGMAGQSGPGAFRAPDADFGPFNPMQSNQMYMQQQQQHQAQQNQTGYPGMFRGVQKHGVNGPPPSNMGAAAGNSNMLMQKLLQQQQQAAHQQQQQQQQAPSVLAQHQAQQPPMPGQGQQQGPPGGPPIAAPGQQQQPNAGGPPGGANAFGPDYLLNLPKQQQQQQQPALFRLLSQNTPPNSQLRVLVQQIRTAVQSGHLNPQILNQPLSPMTLQLLYQLLQQIKLLHNFQSECNSDNINTNIAQGYINQFKQRIKNLQSQIAAQQQLQMQQSQQGGPGGHHQMQQTQAQGSPQQQNLGGHNGALDILKQAAANPGVLGDQMHDLAMGGGDTSKDVSSRLNQWKLPSYDGGNNKVIDGTWSVNRNSNNSMSSGGMKSATDNNWPPTSGASGNMAGGLSNGSQLSGGVNNNDNGSMDVSNGKKSNDSQQNNSTPPPASTPSSTSAGASSASSSSAASSTITTTATTSSAFDFISEFEPGKPWKGNTPKSAEDDPHMTPASVTRNPLLLGGGFKNDLWNKTLGSDSSSLDANPLATSLAASFGMNLSKKWNEDPWSNNNNNKFRPPLGWDPDSSMGGRGSETFLLLKNLTPQIDGSTLKTLCSQHGPLQLFHLFLSSGLALVQYNTREECLKAEAALNNCVLSNTTIQAYVASDAEAQNYLQSPGSTSRNNSSYFQQRSYNMARSGSNKTEAPANSTWGATPTTSVSPNIWNSYGSNSTWSMGASAGGSNDQLDAATASALNSWLPNDLLNGESM